VALRPSDDSALILAIELPPGLERLRRRHVLDAVGEGIPAHATLLYPFAEPRAIDGAMRSVIAGIAASHAPWTLTLAGRGRWPDTLYATVEPDGPIRALQGDLAAAFPSLPLYRDPALRFEPHVTVAEGDGAADPAAATDPAWRELPVARDVREVALIVREGGRWRVGWVFPLGAAK